MKNSNNAEERKAYFQKIEDDNSKMSYKPLESTTVIELPSEILDEIQPEISLMNKGVEFTRQNELLNENPGIEEEPKDDDNKLQSHIRRSSQISDGFLNISVDFNCSFGLGASRNSKIMQLGKGLSSRLNVKSTTDDTVSEKDRNTSTSNRNTSQIDNSSVQSSSILRRS